MKIGNVKWENKLKLDNFLACLKSINFLEFTMQRRGNEVKVCSGVPRLLDSSSQQWTAISNREK